MAKTRSQSSSNKLNSNLVVGLKPNKKKNKLSKTAVERKSKIKNFPSAAKLQSQDEMEKKSDVQATEDLLKLCRPFSICLTRIDENCGVDKSK